MNRFFFLLIFHFQITIIDAQITFLRNDQGSVIDRTCCFRQHYLKQDGSYLVAGRERLGLFQNYIKLVEFDNYGTLIKTHNIYDSLELNQHQNFIFVNDTLFWYNALYSGFSLNNYITILYNIDGTILKKYDANESFEKIFQINDSLLWGKYCKRLDNGVFFEDVSCSSLIVNIQGDSLLFFEDAEFIDLDHQGNYYVVTKLTNEYWLKKYSSNAILLLEKNIQLQSAQNIEFIKVVDGKLLIYYRDIYSGQYFHYNLLCLDENFEISWQLSGHNEDSISNSLGIVKNVKEFPLTAYITFFEREPLSFYSGLYKLKESGVLEKINEYKIENEDIFIGQRNFSFSPSFQTPDGGYFGGASHWNSPYQFNIMKTDSLGRVFESDYLGGITFTGISENDVPFTPNQIALYPNPNNGQFRIGNEELGIVEVYNLQGQKVHSQRVNQINELINLNQPQSGVYLLRFIQENGTVKNAKFIVE